MSLGRRDSVTDRELLEAAASATGYDLLPEGKKLPLALKDGDPKMMPWDPLASDADAFRLAVKLGVTAHQYSTCVVAKRHLGDGINCEESFGDDPYAATRRAIVRAAAEVGANSPARTEEVAGE
jgi:hypothetical protein